MHKLLPIAIAATLAVTPVLAATQNDAPVDTLPAGTAAGVSEAPLVAGGTLWWVAGVAVVAAAAAVAVSGGHHSSTSTTTTSGH